MLLMLLLLLHHTALLGAAHCLHDDFTAFSRRILMPSIWLVYVVEVVRPRLSCRPNAPPARPDSVRLATPPLSSGLRVSLDAELLERKNLIGSRGLEVELRTAGLRREGGRVPSRLVINMKPKSL